MHYSIIVAIIIIIILLLIWAYYYTQQKRHYNHYIHRRGHAFPVGHDEYKLLNKKLCLQSDPECNMMEYKTPARGMHELEQDILYRGFLPNAAQPDHTANLWKSDQSQVDDKQYQEIKGEHIADNYMPSRGRIVNLCVGDQSNMHLASRFNTEQS